MSRFTLACPVWGYNLVNEGNQFLGFVCSFVSEEEITVKIAARSYYRLYINGQHRASGPARAAHGCCRIDEIRLMASGTMSIAIEVFAMNSPDQYSNDCTMEPGLLAAEVTDSQGNVVSATGDGSWSYRELFERRSLVETMSHSRGIIEWYDLDEDSFRWRMGEGDFHEPVPREESVTFLPRRAPYATYTPIAMETLETVSDVVGAVGDTDEIMQIARYVKHEHYKMVPDENMFLMSLRQERDAAFTGKHELLHHTAGKKITLTPGKNPAAITFGRDKSELGFIDFDVLVTGDYCLDVINTDHLHHTGAFESNTYATRYNLKPGRYHLTTMEPKLTRYIRMIFRTQAQVTVSYPVLLDDSYPDTHDCFFSCSDGDLNAIYEASRRTLRLNTLDIFMDCPERERGGWLCDSQFSAQAAWQMFGDSSVEQDFLENFMLTDGTKKWKGFFPEVYPGSKKSDTDVGITTWSFWLAAQLYDYYQRSGNSAFLDACRDRVRCFVEGVLSLRGESGLLEGLTDQFVDWSISNKAFCLEPINIPTNCLAVYALEKLAELYNEPEWAAQASEMRTIIEALDSRPSPLTPKGDGALYENGQLHRSGCVTEAGVAYELWSGFHLDDRKYIHSFANTMGTAPKYRSDPNIGKANIFIGLIVRLDVLGRLGQIETLVSELKDIYLAELRDGSGTFFENFNAFSGCHGANGLIGTLLANKVLGLGQPSELSKSIKLMPSPCGLRWARGSARCSDGLIFMSYRADYAAHKLDIALQIPAGWSYELELPFELCGWEIMLNDKAVNG